MQERKMFIFLKIMIIINSSYLFCIDHASFQSKDGFETMLRVSVEVEKWYIPYIPIKSPKQGIFSEFFITLALFLESLQSKSSKISSEFPE